jgi:hypothetical protein
MDSNDIRDGITLYQYSNTSQRGGRATDVLHTLWDLFQRKRIVFDNLGRATLHGDWSDQSQRLRVNINYMNSLPKTMRLGALSLVLVHEGTHATVPFANFYDELAARILPIWYYRELTGPGVFNEASDVPGSGKNTEIVRCPPGALKIFDEQNAALTRDQLVDYIFSKKTYTSDQYVTAQWVIDNLNNWHGLSNRRPETRGLYISKLAKQTDSYYTRAILDIMESVKTRAEWDTMMENAGPLRPIRVVLDDLSANRQYGARLVAIEKKWNINLHDDPPAPKKK